MKNKLIAMLAAVCMLITGCSAPSEENAQPAPESSSSTVNGGSPTGTRVFLKYREWRQCR